MLRSQRSCRVPGCEREATEPDFEWCFDHFMLQWHFSGWLAHGYFEDERRHL